MGSSKLGSVGSFLIRQAALSTLSRRTRGVATLPPGRLAPQSFAYPLLIPCGGAYRALTVLRNLLSMLPSVPGRACMSVIGGGPLCTKAYGHEGEHNTGACEPHRRIPPAVSTPKKKIKKGGRLTKKGVLTKGGVLTKEGGLPDDKIDMPHDNDESFVRLLAKLTNEEIEPDKEMKMRFLFELACPFLPCNNGIPILSKIIENDVEKFFDGVIDPNIQNLFASTK